ncbi:MAG: DUF58 domain-containing protein, partial [Longispora sp.]|nr:DUF58 domain-containing protein [Longispora sp. (in: high G+C Gram-positive bacteria)]
MALNPRPGRYDEADWIPTRALRRSVLLTVLLLLVAAVTGRPDVVVLAAPFAIGMAVALRNRPRRLPDGVVSTQAPLLTEGAQVQVQISLANQDRVAYDLAVVRTRISPWLDVVNTDRPLVTAVPPSGVVDLDLVGWARRWGHQAVGPLQVSAAACGAMLESRPIVSKPLLLKVFPTTDQFKAVEAMPKAAGLVGVHRSRRYGDGGELAGIRQFASGDRLRRIDWRTSLRTRELHVAHTLSDRDAELVLLLDVLHEVGQPWAIDPATHTAPLLPDGSPDNTPTVLDTTVRAAAALAQYYLSCGDRVSMMEYGARARWLRAGSGRRQYLAALEWLLDVTPSDAEYDP